MPTAIPSEEFESDLLLPLNTGTTEENDQITTIVETISESTYTSTDGIETTLTVDVLECNREGYIMLPYRTIYLFLITLASIFILLGFVIVLICMLYKRKKFRPRHGEYKLTTLRNLSDKLKTPRKIETEEMY